MTKILATLTTLLEVLVLYLTAKERTYKYDLERQAQEEITSLRVRIAKLRTSDSVSDKEEADELRSMLEHRIKRTKQILADEIEN